MTEAPIPTVFAIRASSVAPSAQQLVESLRRNSANAGWGFNVLTAEMTKVIGEGWERRAELLRPADAAGLYRSLHRRPCLVATVSQAVWVRRDPRRNPPARRAATPLEDFVMHKSLYRLVRDPSAVNDALELLARWSKTIECTGDDDPRILPHPTFTSSIPLKSLSTSAGRIAFRTVHGQPRLMTDHRELRWRTGPNHGYDKLVVAGQPLSRGLHWDVTSSGEVLLTAPAEVWQMRPPGYLNVGPDAGVRRTGKGSAVKRVWPKKTA